MSNTETDHVTRARRLLHYAENANGDHLNTAQEGTLNALAGIGHALLDVADAIREQTRAFQDDGIRALTERNA